MNRMRRLFVALMGAAQEAIKEAINNMLLKTRQLTCYMVGDDGDYEKGIAESYTALTTGQYALTTNVDSPHYAAATISFDSANKKILDSANGLVTFLTGDTIRVRGSVANDGVYTVATGGHADYIVTTEALTDGAAAPYITLCKRVAPSNNCVTDNVTKLMWLRYTTGGPVQKVGASSDGKLNWYDATKCYTVHAAAGNLQMTATGIKIVGGAGEIARYFAGMVIVCSGFANAVNNLPGYVVTTVAVNGADLDLTLQKNNNTLIAEAAAGSRAIKVVCQSIFSYCAAANAASLGGYTDWRVPVDVALKSLCDMEAPTGAPNSTAFPSWVADYYWSSTVQPNNTPYAMVVGFSTGGVGGSNKTIVYFVALVRG